MQFDLITLNDTPFATVLEYLNRGFEDYTVPVHFTQPLLTFMIRAEAIDFNTSRVALANGEPAGIALIATRGWTSRLSAFGIFSEQRGKGLGRWFAAQMIAQAQQRRERAMVLETIVSNTPAVRLYRGAGFQETSLLVGYEGSGLSGEANAAAEEIDPLQAARAIIASKTDLPWQIAGESLAQSSSHLRAFRLGDAYALFQTFGEGNALLRGLHYAQAEEAQALLRHLFSLQPSRTWKAGPHFPEALIAPVLEPLGLKRISLAQYAMRRDLSLPPNL